MATNIFDRLREGVTTADAAETRALGAALAEALGPDRTLALHGDLGVGKTTFVQGLGAGLGVRDPVTSPSFALANVHRGARGTLVHLDAFRLEHPRQVDALLLEEFLVSPWTLAVEWPERVGDWLPRDALHLDLGIAADGRHRVRLR